MIALEIESVLAVRAKENQGTRNDLFQFVEKSPEPIQAAKKGGKIAFILQFWAFTYPLPEWQF